MPTLKPAKMPIPPTIGVGLLVPPIGGGQRDEPPGRGRPEQGPDHDCGSRQGNHRHDGAHRR